MKYIDLHTHTIYSDGILSPREIVEAAKLNGLDMLAITDHDSMRGYNEAKKEAEKWDIELIPGAELSTKDYHILGLNFDVENKNMQDFLKYSQSLQRKTCEMRANLLKEHGVPISIEKIESYFPESRLGKGNISRTLVLDKECREWIYKTKGRLTPDEITRTYLLKGGIASELTNKPGLTNKEAIDGIHEAGGTAILAHPPKEIKSLEEIDELVKLGLEGVEIQPNHYGNNYKVKYKLVEDYAKRNNLLITYGSDHHGPIFQRPLLRRGMNIASQDLEERLSKVMVA